MGDTEDDVSFVCWRMATNNRIMRKPKKIKWGHGDLNSDMQVTASGATLLAQEGGIWSLPYYQLIL